MNDAEAILQAAQAARDLPVRQRRPAPPTSYNVNVEAARIIEALEIKGGKMTLCCALTEAYEAGKARARFTGWRP